jgi:ABC-type branched-subunit amino acid transport system ATPase component
MNATTDPTTLPAPTAESSLSTRALSVRFGGTQAVREVSLDLPANTVAGLIGPNGAGKSTLLNAVSGLVPVSGGDVFLFGERITKTRAHDLARRGLGRAFQGVQFVPELSAVENVMIGDHVRLRAGLFRSIVPTPGIRREEREARERAMECLRRVGVEHAADSVIADLPFGVQKRVDIARAIMSEPRCLLLDEPMAGLSVDEKAQMSDVVAGLSAESGLSVVLVEHDMRVVNRLCSYIVVLDAGRWLAAGDPAEVLSRPEVVEAYIGRPRSGVRNADAIDAETHTGADPDEPGRR